MEQINRARDVKARLKQELEGYGWFNCVGIAANADGSPFVRVYVNSDPSFEREWCEISGVIPNSLDEVKIEVFGMMDGWTPYLPVKK